MAILTTALVSTLLGAFTGALPDVIGIFKNKQEQTYALQKLEIQAKLGTTASADRLKELNIEADISEGKSLHDHDAGLTGGWFINSLRASIRPVLTILFFVMWAAIKIIVLVNALSSGTDLIPLIPLIWDVDTQVIFGSILGFWFGTRAMEKLKKD